MAKHLKLIKQNFLLWGIGFLLLFIPLYPKFPLHNVAGTYVAIRLEDIFVALLVGIFGIKIFYDFLVKKDYSFLKNYLNRLIFFYLIVGLISVISGIFITKNITSHLAFLHWLRRVEYISLFFVAYYSLKEFKQLKFLGWAVLISTFGVIIYGIGQKFFGWPVISTMNKEFSKGLFLTLTWWARINSTFAGHYDLAAYMVMILPLTVASLLIVKKWSARILIFLLGVLSYYLIILTASRISFGAYLVAVCFVIIFSGRKWWIIPFLAISILGMIFSDDLGQRYAATFKIDLSFLSGKVHFGSSKIALVPTTIPSPTPIVAVVTAPVRPSGGRRAMPRLTLTPTPSPEATASGYYIESTALAVGRSTDIRLKVEWPRAIAAFLKSPALGTGFSSITLATDNDYLRMLGETGLLGTLAFMAIILEFFRKFYFSIKFNLLSRNEKLIILGIGGAAIGYFLNAAFIDVLEASKIAFFFWIMMGIGLKIVDLRTEKAK